jgi:hypothetical protein
MKQYNAPTLITIALAIIFICVVIASIMGAANDIRIHETPGTPVGIVYSNGTYIRFDNTSAYLSLACSPMAEQQNNT